MKKYLISIIITVFFVAGILLIVWNQQRNKAPSTENDTDAQVTPTVSQSATSPEPTLNANRVFTHPTCHYKISIPVGYASVSTNECNLDISASDFNLPIFDVNFTKNSSVTPSTLKTWINNVIADEQRTSLVKPIVSGVLKGSLEVASKGTQYANISTYVVSSYGYVVEISIGARNPDIDFTPEELATYRNMVATFVEVK